MTVSTTQFDATSQPASSLALRVTLLITALYACLALALLPIASQPGPIIPGLIAFFTAGIFITEISTAYLLSVLFREDRRLSLLLLFCAYVFSALMAIAQLLTFPGAILPTQPLIVAEVQTSAWIFLAWLYGFALLTFAAVYLEAWDSERRLPAGKVSQALVFGLASILLATVVIVASAAWSVDWLPTMIADQRFANTASLRAGAVILFCASIAIILLKIRDKNPLYLWLSLALTAMVFQNVLAAFGGARFSIGWSLGRVSWLLSAAALFIFFLHLFSRQHRLLTRTRDLLESVTHDSASGPQVVAPVRRLSLTSSIERFVARENIGRYQGMLRSSLDVGQRQAISNLLAEEEARLKTLTNGNQRPTALTTRRIDHLF